ncbi:MAG: LamG-like jellyroll fold domain-containing protein [Patescibacteria group bacterium]
MLNTKPSRKNPKASALAVTLIIMGIIIASALSVAFVALKERRGSIGASKSSAAYQMAETGIEQVLYEVLKKTPPPADTSKLDNCQDELASMPGYIVVNNSLGSYKLELKDKDENKIECYSAAPIADVRKIKATGIVGQNSRAIQVSLEEACSADRPIGYWELNNNGNDSNTNIPVNNATINGAAAWVAGKYGNALNFNGSTYAETPKICDAKFAPGTSDPSCAGTVYTPNFGPFVLDKGTVSAWVKLNDPGLVVNNYFWGWKKDFATFHGTEGGLSYAEWGFQSGNTTQAQIYVEWKAKCSVGNPHASIITDSAVTIDNNWHLVTFVADGESRVKIYWDGAEMTPTTYDPGGCSDLPNLVRDSDFTDDINFVNSVYSGWWPEKHRFTIGGCVNSSGNCGGTNGNWFSGPIDDVRTYNCALPESEIQKL